MNSVALMGRLTNDPKITYSQGPDSTCIARYTLAVDRIGTGPDGKKEADFINCVAFRKPAEWAERYLHKGTKIAVIGRIQTGSYTNRDGQKVYTTEVVINSQEFAESLQKPQQPAYQSQPNNYKPAQSAPAYAPAQKPKEGLPEGWLDIPSDVEQAELPWN